MILSVHRTLPARIGHASADRQSVPRPTAVRTDPRRQAGPHSELSGAVAHSSGDQHPAGCADRYPGVHELEQAEMSALEVDTRTDVYSLSVLLYELLAGALPFEEKLKFIAKGA